MMRKEKKTMKKGTINHLSPLTKKHTTMGKHEALRKEHETMKKTNESQISEKQKKDLLLNLMSELSYCESKDGLCATIHYGERKEIVLITNQKYSDYITDKYHEMTGEIPRLDWIKERLQLIRHKQRVKHTEEVIFESRYVECDGKILINMSNEKLQYISVTPDTYEIITPEDDKPLFVTDSMEKPMPEPCENYIDAVNLMDDLLNLNEDDKFFLKIWLVAVMNPNIRTPILYFIGTNGSGKSSIQKLISDLINPSIRETTNWDGITPKELAIALNRSYLINYDNVSKIDQMRSDILCQATTGGNKSFRKLYTDNVEINYNLQSKVTISSTRNCVMQPDLAERVYFMNMLPASNKRIPENEYPKYCSEYCPQILGGLLSILSAAIGLYEKWRKKHTATYRLASFELFGSLIAVLLDTDNGYERFQRIMRRNHIQQIFSDDNKRSYFEALLEMIDADQNPFEGKMKELYECTNEWIIEYSDLPYTDDIILDYESFSKAIHYYKDGFASLGYYIEFFKSRPDNYASIKIGRQNETESA